MEKTSKTKAPRPEEATVVPDLGSEADAADWYDTHDTAHLPSEPAEDYGRLAKPALDTVAVRLSRREVNELKRRAAKLGIGYTTYVRMLINRHVLQEPPIQ